MEGQPHTPIGKAAFSGCVVVAGVGTGTEHLEPRIAQLMQARHRRVRGVECSADASSADIVKLTAVSFKQN